MPNIKTFEAPITGLDISDRGVEGFSQASHTARQMGVQSKRSLDEAGREIGGGLEAIGGELRREAKLKDDETISKADLLAQNVQANNDSLQLSIKAHDSYTTAMQEALKAEKYDPDWHKKWIQEKFLPMVDQYRGTAQSTQNGQHIESHVESLSHSYLTRAFKDDADIQGFRAQRSFEGRVASNMTMIDRENGSPEALIEGQRSLAIDLNGTKQAVGNLGGEASVQFEKHVAEVQRGFTERSAEKYIMAGTNAADIARRKEEVKKDGSVWTAGPYPLKQTDFEKLDHWEHQANTAAQQRVTQLRQKTEQEFSGMAGDMFVDLHAKGPDANFLQKLKTWREDPAHPERKEQITEARLEAFYKNYSEAAKAPDDQTKLPNPDVVESFRQRIGGGQDVQIDELMAAEAKGDISKKQFDEFNARVKERNTLAGKDLSTIRKDFFEKHKPLLDSQFGQTKYPQGTPLGQQNVFKFEAAARAKEEELRKAGKDPKSLYDPSSPEYIGKDENLSKWRTTKQDNEHYELQLKQQQSTNNGVSDPLLDHIKSVEGFTKTSKWDNKQNSYGYGTRAPGPGVEISKDDAHKELVYEAGKAAREVDAFQPGLPPGIRDAMISLTFNAGPGQWTQGGLGAALKQGDYMKAKEIFLTYSKSNNPNDKPGLQARRDKEAVWFDKAIAQQQASVPVARTPEEARAKFQPGQVFRTPEGRILRVPRTKQD